MMDLIACLQVESGARKIKPPKMSFDEIMNLR